jgi:sulfide:quinone oxidoreductase
MPTNVLIVGGGPAALEAALALHRLAGDRIATTVLAPESEFTYRPLSVLAPFAAGGATSYPFAQIAADAGFTHLRGRLRRVDVVAHTVETETGEQLPYDALVVAAGARPVTLLEDALTFTGSPADQERMHGIVQDVEGGYLRSCAFVLPSGSTWPLPLYELALMLAERADEMCVDLKLHIVTPEASPLELFGPDPAREVAALLAEAGIVVHTGTGVEPAGSGRLRLAPGDDMLEVQRVVTLPRLEGPSVAGLPSDARGFLVTDDRGRVQGVPDVYAAGDITAFPIKQGGIVCQQADAVAESIAARAGVELVPAPFHPVLRGLLLTERRARFMRRDSGDATVAGRALWWPPTKIAGRELAGFLERLDEQAGRPSELPVNIDVGEGGTGGIEVLSMN